MMIHCPAVMPLFCSLLCASGQQPECCVQVCRIIAAFEGRMVGCRHCSQCAKLYSVQCLQSVGSYGERAKCRPPQCGTLPPSPLCSRHRTLKDTLLCCFAMHCSKLRGLHTVHHTAGRKGEHRMQCRSCCSDTAVGKIQNCGRTKQSARAQWEWEQWEQWEQ